MELARDRLRIFNQSTKWNDVVLCSKFHLEGNTFGRPFPELLHTPRHHKAPSIASVAGTPCPSKDQVLDWLASNREPNSSGLIEIQAYFL